jgi:hypothetical protein
MRYRGLLCIILFVCLFVSFFLFFLSMTSPETLRGGRVGKNEA